jgi:hypothetical protein
MLGAEQRQVRGEGNGCWRRSKAVQERKRHIRGGQGARFPRKRAIQTHGRAQSRGEENGCWGRSRGNSGAENGACFRLAKANQGRSWAKQRREWRSQPTGNPATQGISAPKKALVSADKHSQRALGLRWLGKSNAEQAHFRAGKAPKRRERRRGEQGKLGAKTENQPASLRDPQPAPESQQLLGRFPQGRRRDGAAAMPR